MCIFSSQNSNGRINQNFEKKLHTEMREDKVEKTGVELDSSEYIVFVDFTSEPWKCFT